MLHVQQVQVWVVLVCASCAHTCADMGCVGMCCMCPHRCRFGLCWYVLHVPTHVQIWLPAAPGNEIAYLAWLLHAPNEAQAYNVSLRNPNIDGAFQ